MVKMGGEIMAFPVKLYIRIDVDGLKVEDKEKIMEEISKFLGYYPYDADYLEEAEELLNEEVYLTYEEIKELEKILIRIHEKYDVDIVMKIWNLEEPDYQLEIYSGVRA